MEPRVSPASYLGAATNRHGNWDVPDLCDAIKLDVWSTDRESNK